jgi:hypothetical protein
MSKAVSRQFGVNYKSVVITGLYSAQVKLAEFFNTHVLFFKSEILGLI